MSEDEENDQANGQKGKERKYLRADWRRSGRYFNHNQCDVRGIHIGSDVDERISRPMRNRFLILILELEDATKADEGDDWALQKDRRRHSEKEASR
jgi:hypothetical protein